MNVKSRAQLIVWCLPHLGFVENESRNEPNAPAANAAYGASVAQTIPTGNAPVSGTPNIIPGRSNDIGRGNGDVGMGM